MSSSSGDKTLEEYLERDSAVSQHYRKLDVDDVPAALDAKVLAQARDAVSSAAQPASMRRPAWLRWGPPLALAASAVMVVAIVLDMGVQDEVQMPTALIEQSAPAAAPERSPAPSTVDRPELDMQESVATSTPTQPPVLASEQEFKATVLADEPRTAVTPQLAGVPAPADSLGTDARQSRVVSPPAPVALKSVTPPATAADTMVTASAAPPVPASKRGEEEQVVATAARRQEAVEPVVVTGNAVNRERRTFGPRAVGVPASAQNREARNDDRARAEEWLVEIRRLRSEGKDAEADEQWAQFRKQFPRFEVERNDLALPPSEREGTP